jgi:hypothetical protein
MEKLDIQISLESFNNGFGEIYIKFSDYIFPGNKWTDFSENLLTWWTEEFAKLLTKKETKAKCGFMDGPVRFDIEVLSGDIWQIQCIREYADSEECEYKTEIEALQATESLLQAVEKMLGLFLEKKDKNSFDFLNKRKLQLLSALKNYS